MDGVWLSDRSGPPRLLLAPGRRVSTAVGDLDLRSLGAIRVTPDGRLLVFATAGDENVIAGPVILRIDPAAAGG